MLNTITLKDAANADTVFTAQRVADQTIYLNNASTLANPWTFRSARTVRPLGSRNGKDRYLAQMDFRFRDADVNSPTYGQDQMATLNFTISLTRGITLSGTTMANLKANMKTILSDAAIWQNFISGQYE